MPFRYGEKPQPSILGFRTFRATFVHANGMRVEAWASSQQTKGRPASLSDPESLSIKFMAECRRFSLSWWLCIRLL